MLVYVVVRSGPAQKKMGARPPTLSPSAFLQIRPFAARFTVTAPATAVSWSQGDVGDLLVDLNTGPFKVMHSNAGIYLARLQR
jgi:hypothetical protein